MAGIKVDGVTYEIASEEERLSAEYLHKVFIRAGRPTKLEGESAWKMMDAIMQIWGGLYPQEVDAFIEVLKEEQALERSVEQSNKEGGYFPISYPTRLYQMMKVYFKNDRFQDRKLIKMLVNRYPILKRTKYEI
jgi:hypothetical protein